MAEDNALKRAFVELRETAHGEQRERTIAKLIGARCEVEDVLLSSGGSAVLSAGERVRLSILTRVIDNIVRRIERR